MKQLSPEERRLARRALYDALEAGELELPETVRRLREVAGMTQAEFGERIAGVSRLTISQIERGEGNPTLDTLNRIGRAFGLTLGFVPKRTPRA
ncbi:MAG: helix-turn-helix transcriptional regulator [Polyangiales bacterium]|nr:helix-turn-helix transcriptional regulator [Myxococcales bacterium]